LELLSLLIDQGPTTRILTCVTCRPEFCSSWGVRAHVTPIVLNRLPRHQAADMIDRMTGGKPLPSEVIQQLLAKTDGVPLFVEELTKMVLESGLVKESQGRYELTGPLPALAIPTTLHDSLMARVDRLGTARGVVQLGAGLGRQFAFDLLQAVSRLEEEIVQRELSKAVEAELLYQQGLPPRATYVFKHDLIRETAYQALLKRTRQQYHHRTAQVLVEHFPEMAATQPELVAHHYTEAGFAAPAVVYWQQAGQCAIERSANPEAAQHLTKGLELLATLPETQARAQQELDLQLALGPVLAAIKSWAMPEVEQVYARARVLCQQVGETPQLFPALRGLCWFYINRGALPTARELGEQLVSSLAQGAAAPMLRLAAHAVLGSTLFHQGAYADAWTHLEQCSALADPTAQWALALRQGDALCGVWHLATGLGAGHTGPGRGGSGADAPGPGGYLGDGAEAGAAARSGPARGGHRAHWPGSGGTTPAGRVSGSTGGKRAGRLARGGVSAQGRIPPEASSARCIPGGSLLSAGPRRGSPPAGEVLGAAGSAESEPALAAPGQAHRGA